MDQNLEINSNDFINLRNQFMTILLVVFFLISFIINFMFNREILSSIVPFGMIAITVISYLNYKRKFPYITLYTIITALYLYIFLVIYLEPILINFILLWLALLVSAIYYKIIPILYALILTTLMSIYFYIKHKQTIFLAQDSTEFIYLIIFIIFVTIYFIFTSQFTERRRREAEICRDLATDELMEMKYYLESLFNQMTDAVVIHNRLGKVIKVNKRFEEIYLWKEAEVVGLEIPYGSEEQFLQLRQLWNRVYQEDIPVQDYQMKHKTKNGQEIDVEISISSIRDNEGTVMALATFSKDISEKLKTEEMILRSEKLSVVGQLAAGVAHEIRNPLTVISGFLQLYHQKDDNDHFHINLMLKEIARINDIINEFLVLSKPKVESFTNVNLQQLIHEVTTLISTTAIIENIEIKTRFLTEDLIIECVPNQIKQVIINLLKNSIDAMQNGGAIEVTVEQKTLEEITVTVNDEGDGMNEAQLSRIGEPFYTTKEKGTGLGLMICFKIIDNHQGKMTFKSELQKGTTVEIKLPIKQNMHHKK